MACTVDIRGPVAQDRLADALRRAVAQTPGPYTRIGGTSGSTMATDDRWPAVVDVSTDDDPEASAWAWIQRRRRQPLDPSLVDLALIRLSGSRWIVYFGYHYLGLDPVGADQMLRRCARIYADPAAPEPYGAIPLPATEAHVETQATQAIDWLVEPPAAMRLADGGDLPDPTGTGQAALDGQHPATTDLAGHLTAILATYVARMRNTDDVLVGVVVEDGSGPEHVERIAPIRMRLSATRTWAGLVAEAGERIHELRQHPGTEWADVWRAATGRDGGMFTVPVVSLRQVGGPVAAGDCRWVIRHLRTVPTDDVAVCGHIGADGTVDLGVVVPPWRVSDTTLADHRDRLALLLEDAFANPDRPALDADILTERDEHRTLVAWQGKDTELPDATVAQLFEQQVVRNPTATAVTYDGTELSYADLHSRANQLAGVLVARGVGPGSRLGILMSRTSDLVIVLVAIAKVGAVYVPLDPRSPGVRMESMLTGVDATLLLVDEAAATHEVTAGRRVLVVSPDVLAGPGSFTAEVDDPEAALYIMHTSGSMGRPKGVIVTHRNVVALAMDRAWRSEAHRRVLFHSPHAFDAATYEVWVPLLTGGCVVVAPGDLNAVLLRRLAGRGQVTAMFLTTGLFNALADGDPGCFQGLHEVWTGGNVTSPAAIATVAAACPDLVLHNVYGPTETTTFATYHRVSRSGRAGMLPIGAPMDNTQAHVLDDRRRPVPPGATGTLHLAGAGVALGYAGQPELTRERFVPNPFGPRGSVMYDTGDLVRWEEDGTLSFHGRADEQVKIHGFRIEPGEIESALTSYPGVSQAAVVAHMFADAGGRIDAFVVPADPHDVVAEQPLRDHLAQRLPVYMVPDRIVSIAEMPLTPNGKIDHARLGAQAAEPSSTERVLAQMWAELLKLTEVSADASFWQLGGHSLLGVKLVERIRKRFGVDLQLRELFRHPRLGDLTAVVDSALQAARAEDGPSPEPVRSPASSFQQRIWFAEQLRGEPGLYHVPLAWRVTGRLVPEQLAVAAAAVVERHEALRTTFVLHDGALHQVIGRPFRPEVGLYRAEDAAALQSLLRTEAEQPFDLAGGPLLRLGIIETPTGQVCTLTVHHIVFDVTSAAILLSELDRYYGTDGSPAPTPGYRDLLAAAPPVADAALRRRVETLRGAPSRLPIAPPEHPRPHRVLPFALPDHLRLRLRAVQEEYGMSWFMVTAAALAGVVHRCARRTDVTFGFPTDLRTDEFAGVVGPCLNMVVVRSRCAAGTTGADLLTRIRDGVLEAIDDRHVPFESIVDDLNPPRDPGSVPYLDVAIGPEVRSMAPPVVGGCTFTPLSTPQTSTVGKFTIILSITAAGDQLTGTVSYRGDRIPREVGDKLPGQLVDMLDAMLNHPDRPVHTAEPEPHGGPHVERRVTDTDGGGELESKVAAIWSSVLAVDRVGSSDNFFDLGGNSLKLVALHGKLCSEFDLELPIQSLFEHATVRDMARFLARDEPAPAPDVGDRGAARRERLRRAARAR